MTAAKSIAQAVVMLLAAASFFILSPAQAQTLSPEERRIAEYVDAHTDEAVRLLEESVNIDSATLNQEGVRRVGQLFRRELEALGFKARWVELPKELKRAGHLFAERTGARGRRILLVGHLDTVLEGNHFKRDGNIVRGAGTVDMKGGDVVILLALRALNSVGALRESSIIVALTGDEESPGLPIELSRRDLREAASRSDVALAFEAGIADTATVARRGSSSWRVEVTGITGHSGGIFGPDVGSGAVFEAARILNTFHQELKGAQYLTFNPSIIVGGTQATLNTEEKRGTAEGKLNVIAQTAIIEGDLRFISEEQKEATRARMREIVAHGLPNTKAQITFADSYPAMSPRPENYELLKLLDQASRDLGLAKVEALDPGARGAGDISFVAPPLAGLDGLGIRGGGAHAPEEFAELDSLPIQIKRAALLIYRLTRTQRADSKRN